MKRVILILIVAFLGNFSSEAQNLEGFLKQADAFFSANVSNGRVAYDAIKKDEILCVLFAFKGFCPRGSDCPLSHDAFQVVKNELNGLIILDAKDAQKKT